MSWDENNYSFSPGMEGNNTSTSKFSMAVSECGSTPSPQDFKVFGSNTCSKFFTSQVTDGHSGVSRLVANSQFGMSSMADKLSSYDISNQLFMTDFIFSLTRTQRTKFAHCMKYSVESTEKRCALAANSKDISVSDSFSCGMPVTYSSIRSVYTEGAKAIIPNLPRPQVKCIAGHSYMSLEQIVAHHLAFCTQCDIRVWDQV